MIIFAGFVGGDRELSILARQLFAAAIPWPVDLRLQNVRRFQSREGEVFSRQAM